MKSLCNYINEALTNKARWILMVRRLRPNVFQIKYIDRYSDRHDYGIYDRTKHAFNTGAGSYDGGVSTLRRFEKDFPKDFSWDEFIKTWEGIPVQLVVDNYPHGKIVNVSEYPYRVPSYLL